jgi:acetyl-CoA acetyltransferase
VKDVDVAELHDCFSTNELLTYEALGLCEEGKSNACCYLIFYMLNGQAPMPVLLTLEA